MNNETCLTKFDVMTTHGRTQIIKAVIPFLDKREQHTISILVRLYELYLTIDFFKSQFFCDKTDNPNDDMLCAIKKYCTKETADQINMIMNMMKMSEVMKIFDDDNNISNLMKMMQPSNTVFPFSTQENTASDNSGDTSSSSPPPATPGLGPNILSSMLSPHQKDLYENYMKILNRKGD